MIKIGIWGYGNLTKAILKNQTLFKDIKVEAIFSRHMKDCVVNNIPVLSPIKFREYIGKLDVMLLCIGSSEDAPKFAPILAKYFNLVDCFDDHQSINKYFSSIKTTAYLNKKVIISATGWDPGLFSIMRTYFDAFLPDGTTHTFWGKGISQGHSEAIRKIDGVVDGIQYTIPIYKAIKKFENAKQKTFLPKEKHLRKCFVTVTPQADKNKIRDKIKNMPHYFADYNTKVKFVSQSYLNKHKNFIHGGFVLRIGNTYEHIHKLKCEIHIDSNPEFTANIMLCYTRANVLFQKENKYGAFSVLDVPPKYLTNNNCNSLI